MAERFTGRESCAALAGPRQLRCIRRVNPSETADSRTAAELREMMEAVVRVGTGMPAQLNGYTAGGKSGTAQKIDPATGRYSATQYNSSFVGFTPVNDPALTILVVLDSPVGPHHGGEVGGPVFKLNSRAGSGLYGRCRMTCPEPPSNRETGGSKCAACLRSLSPAVSSVKADAEAEERIRKRSFDEALATRTPGSRCPARTAIKAATHPAPRRSLSGEQSEIASARSERAETVRGVMEYCLRLGLVPMLIGNGVALEQYPESGAQVMPRQAR